MSSVFERAGYRTLAGNPNAAKPLYQLDRIFYLPASQRAVFVQSGVQPQNPAHQDTYYEVAGGLLYNGVTAAGHGFAVFQTTTDGADAQRALRRIHQGLDTVKPIDGGARLKKVIDVFLAVIGLPTAHATSTAPCGELEGPLPQTLAAIGDAERVANPDYMSMAWNCLVGAGSGVWNATGGAAIGVGKMIGKLFSDPGGFWKDIQETWEALTYVVTNFPEVAGKVWSDFKNLPPDQKAKLLCEFIAEIGTGIALTAVAGAGAVSLAARIQRFLSKARSVRRIAKGKVPSIGALRKSAPIEIPKNAKVISGPKAGYVQAKFRWNDGPYKVEARWHSKTPGAPDGTGSSWVITRTKPGTAQGQRRLTEVRLRDPDEWIPESVWNHARGARGTPRATPETERILDRGHIPSDI